MAKKLYELEIHPYLKIETKGKTLVITFQDNYSSYSKWYEVHVKYDKEANNYVLIENKSS